MEDLLTYVFYPACALMCTVSLIMIAINTWEEDK
jgi:hypothetical protein